MKDRTIQVETTWGIIEVGVSDGAIVSCILPFLERRPDIEFIVRSRRKDAVTRCTAGILNGRPVAGPTIRLPEGTAFQQDVWKAISRIPAGRTISYTELAQAAGRPRAVRAAAGACGKNPLPLFIPCHRIVTGNGGLGGFSAGLPWKELLLSVEHKR